MPVIYIYIYTKFNVTRVYISLFAITGKTRKVPPYMYAVMSLTSYRWTNVRQEQHYSKVLSLYTRQPKINRKPENKYTKDIISYKEVLVNSRCLQKYRFLWIGLCLSSLFFNNLSKDPFHLRPAVIQRPCSSSPLVRRDKPFCWRLLVLR